jgi:hypothetical protein
MKPCGSTMSIRSLTLECFRLSDEAKTLIGEQKSVIDEVRQPDR